MRPIALPTNPMERFYAGGPRIGAFRGKRGWSPTAPEDWVGSTTLAAGSDGAGRSRSADGSVIAEAIERDPQAFLGTRHAARFGAQTGLLVKLLDSGQRLPVHWHPDRRFAAAHMGSAYGKTEAWIVLAAEPGSEVHLGFLRSAERDAAAWFDRQDAEAMLAAMHALDVAPGDAIFVPAGTPHAIGAGILLLELQEPTDLGMLLEWRGFLDGPDGAFQGIDPVLALSSLDTDALDGAALDRLRGTPRTTGAGIETLLPEDADGFFRAERVADGAELEAGFAIVVVLEGEGVLEGDGWTISAARGDAFLVPFAAGDVTVHGPVSAVRCRPPLEPPAQDAA